MKKGILRTSALFLLCLLTACLFGACISPNENNGADPSEQGGADEAKWYVLTEKTVEGTSVAEEYIYNCISLQNGQAAWYEADYSGLSEKQGTYREEDGKIIITVGVREYAYALDETGSTMTFSGKIDRQDVIMRYTYKEGYSLPSAAAEGVDFTDELFGESKDENFYNYCPTAIMEGNDTMHVWYCSNRDSGNVTDYVAYRKGTLNSAGKWEFTEKQIVIEHGAAGEWDSRHVCDPAVIRGNFSMAGQQYSYLMAYLGCVTSNNCCNEVGIALAKAPEGPWIKAENINPIANFYTSEHYVETGWGYGQPSLVSVDGAGKVLLFYAMGAGKTCTIAEEWDLSDVDDPVLLRRSELNERGSVNSAGAADCINNADFAYDPVLGRLYCIKEDFPYPVDGGVNWIAGSNTIMYMETDETFDLLFGDETYTWNVCGALTTGTGHARNHNACIVRDEFARIVNPYRLPVLYTAAQLSTDFPDWNLGGQWPSLHTYRLHGIVIDVR